MIFFPQNKWNKYVIGLFHLLIFVLFSRFSSVGYVLDGSKRLFRFHPEAYINNIIFIGVYMYIYGISQFFIVWLLVGWTDGRHCCHHHRLRCAPRCLPANISAFAVATTDSSPQTIVSIGSVAVPAPSFRYARNWSPRVPDQPMHLLAWFRSIFPYTDEQYR